MARLKCYKFVIHGNDVPLLGGILNPVLIRDVNEDADEILKARHFLSLPHVFRLSFQNRPAPPDFGAGGGAAPLWGGFGETSPFTAGVVLVGSAMRPPCPLSLRRLVAGRLDDQSASGRGLVGFGPPLLTKRHCNHLFSFLNSWVQRGTLRSKNA